LAAALSEAALLPATQKAPLGHVPPLPQPPPLIVAAQVEKEVIPEHLRECLDQGFPTHRVQPAVGEASRHCADNRLSEADAFADTQSVNVS
jgi:hypothetical protein